MGTASKSILIVLDGWGIGKKDKTDGPFLAKTPFFDKLIAENPSTTLKTYGENVGLPNGQMGNSEVGHMNIGAGRIVWQMLVRINKSFAENNFENIEKFKKILTLLEENPNRKLHLVGLVSDGGVHSSQEHLLEITKILKKLELDKRTIVHAFTDGRDTDPRSGKEFLLNVTNDERFGNTTLGTVCGRYYAMDRDKRWERTAKAYHLLVNGKGEKYDSLASAFDDQYHTNTTDEFLPPIILQNGVTIKPDDIIFCFNFRTDRGRQIIDALTQQSFPEQDMKPISVHTFTMTEYDRTFQNVNVIFDNQDLKNTLGEVISGAGKTQTRAAETEKYPHVTFFFNGGRETPFLGEHRIMATSPKVATYDLQPAMSAPELTESVMKDIQENSPDLLVLNFANPDMVGHTGVPEAILQACETVDSCLEKVVTEGLKQNYQFLITADHGNSDKMMNEDGSPNTAHSTNLVPCIVISQKVKSLHTGILADIAPTLLELMGMSIPQEMDGKSLVAERI